MDLTINAYKNSFYKLQFCPEFQGVRPLPKAIHISRTSE